MNVNRKLRLGVIKLDQAYEELFKKRCRLLNKNSYRHFWPIGALFTKVTNIEKLNLIKMNPFLVVIVLTSSGSRVIVSSLHSWHPLPGR